MRKVDGMKTKKVNGMRKDERMKEERMDEADRGRGSRRGRGGKRKRRKEAAFPIRIDKRYVIGWLEAGRR